MAEKDPFLSEAYWDNGDFDTIESHDDPRCFLIGRTGSGKSALLQRLEEIHPQKVVRIIPENLSLPYITNLGVIRQLLQLNVRLEPFLKALWKHVIIVEILRHRYTITSPEQKQTVLSNLKERFRRDPVKIKAIEYLNEFGDKFWCEADERVKQIAETFERKIETSAEIGANAIHANAKASADFEQTNTREIKSELAAKYQRIVNDTQISRLNEMIKVINEAALDEQHFIYVIIDDLDKEWEDERIANLIVQCLFQAVVDIQDIKHLKMLVALRTNIFRQLHYGEHSKGGQEEKFRGLALHLRWTSNDLHSLLTNRAEAASRRYSLNPPKTLTDMLPNANKNKAKNKGDIDPIKYILDRTLMRPRDAILYLNSCVREATGKETITWQNIYQAEKYYSEERLLALRDEWKDPYLDINRIFERFKHQPSRMSRGELTIILDDIILLLGDTSFRGTTWLANLCEPLWAAGSSNLTWYEWYGSLVNLLYTISFLGLAKGKETQACYSYEQADRVQKAVDMLDTAFFEIHPAFHSALDIKTSLNSNG